MTGDPDPAFLRGLGDAGISPVYAFPACPAVMTADREGLFIADVPGGEEVERRIDDLARIIAERAGMSP